MDTLLSIEADGYDLDVFERIYRSEPDLVVTEERLGRLIPHPKPLLIDVFSVLFKLNVVVRPHQEVAGAVLINRRLVDSVLGHPGIKSLRAQTQLDEAKTRDALVLVTDRILRSLARRDRARPEDLAEGLTSAETEEALAQTKKTLRHLQSLDVKNEDLEKRLKGEIRELEQQLKTSRQRQMRNADNLPIDMDNEIASSVSRMSDELSELDQNLENLGLKEERQTTRQKLELGEQLAQSKKLRLLAKLTGAFKDVAHEARKQKISRAPQTAHAVNTGSDLAHLLPSEWPGLDKKRSGVHLDFLRRFVEGKLLQYDLRAPADRGPIVVCVDGSGSMTGSKEIWAKAVALTLMEIARKERRRCLGIIFSDGQSPFEVELLSQRSAKSMTVQKNAVLSFAEHFPGGGTAFEPPLRLAVTAVTEGKYRNGDVVFITDGEAPISQPYLEEVREKKKRHRFKIRGILIDLRSSKSEALDAICDEVRAISDLTGESLSSLFAAV